MRGIKPVVLSWEEDEEVERVQGERDNVGKGTKQQFKKCMLTSNCWKHPVQVAQVSDEVCACKCCKYLCISTQCNLLWG